MIDQFPNSIVEGAGGQGGNSEPWRAVNFKVDQNHVPRDMANVFISHARDQTTSVLIIDITIGLTASDVSSAAINNTYVIVYTSTQAMLLA